MSNEQQHKYRKRPVVVEAWRNADDTGWPTWLDEVDVGREPGGVILIRTLEGIMRAEPLDWIIRGVKGEVYPCKPDIFATTYEVVDGATALGEQQPMTAEQMAEIEREVNRFRFSIPVKPPQFPLPFPETINIPPKVIGWLRSLLAEVQRLNIVVEQHRGALGYPVAGDIPDDPSIINGLADALEAQGYQMAGDIIVKESEIDHLTAEIERLTADRDRQYSLKVETYRKNAEWQEQHERLTAEVQRQQGEIERLTAERTEMREEYVRYRSNLRAEKDRLQAVNDQYRQQLGEAVEVLEADGVSRALRYYQKQGLCEGGDYDEIESAWELLDRLKGDRTDG
ncbi:hypothetical protein [Paenibacillus sp. D9]|uniref:hypothetical protein n=1 Tax=Paenibacillus sp. D9 TaxID=665792 RepID=UPI000841227F|nr:hypothetical protein [Paenibacillus sp. D9]